MKLKAIKTFLAGGGWVHAGTDFDADEIRGKDLKRNGLAVEVVEEKAEPEPENKMNHAPKNKSEDAGA